MSRNPLTRVPPPVIEGGPDAGSQPPPSPPSPAGSGKTLLFALALAVTGVFALSCLFNGFYDFHVWAPVTLVLLLVLVGVVLLGPLEMSRPAQLTLVGFLVLLGWAALSMTWAESTSRAWTEVNRLAFYTATFLVVVSAIRTRAQGQLVMRVLAVGFAAVVLYVTARLIAFDGAELFIAFRLAEPMGYVNGEAGFFLMGFWALLAVAEAGRHAAVRGAGLAAATLAGSMLVLTQSRAIVPALVISGAVMVAVLPGRIRRGWAILISAVAVLAATPWLFEPYDQHGTQASGLPTDGAVQSAGIAAVVVALLAGVAWAVATTVAQRHGRPEWRRWAIAPLIAIPLVALVAGTIKVGDPFEKVGNEWDRFTTLGVDTASGSRFTSLGGTRHDLWRIALDDLADDPVAGLGAGNYGLTYFQQRRTTENVRQPHSLELQVLAELGLVGGLGLIALIGGVMWAIFSRRLKTVGRDSLYVRVAATGMFLVWFLHTSIDWLHNLPGVTGIALVSAAVLMARPEETRADADLFDDARRWRNLLLVGAVAVIAAAAMSVGRQYAADRYRESGESQLGDDPRAALADANRAIDLDPGDMAARYLRSAAHARFGDYERAREALAEAARREPHNPVPWALLGDLAVRRGDLAQAAQDYSRASELNPKDQYLAEAAADPRSVIE